MSRIILVVAVLAALPWVTPASAQYRFDWRIDPQVCDWRWTCDYGGRAYLPRWAHGRRWVHRRARVHHVYYAPRYYYAPSYPHW